jgi:ring-1,2-phenylacetyl-CoA epoxidase subunit PaaD
MVGQGAERLETEAWRQRRARRESSALPQLWALLDRLSDPEIPVLSLWDLGILRDLELQGDELVVTITPTYSGCPAMSEIEQDIRSLLQSAGYPRVRVETRLSPAWSSDDLSPQARRALEKYGIAPPCAGCEAGAGQPACPRCGAETTRPIAEFGSTACKALWQCDHCHETFDYFKPI